MDDQSHTIEFDEASPCGWDYNEVKFQSELCGVFCEAARMLNVTVCSDFKATKPSVAVLMKQVLGELGALAGEFAIKAVPKAIGLIVKGLKSYALKKFSQAHDFFSRVIVLELRLPTAGEAPPDAAWASCVFCRAQMYACLHLNDCCLLEAAAADRRHVTSLECRDLYESLVCSPHVLTCLADEFDPLPSGLPRLAGHVPFSRVRVLRDLACLRGVLLRKFRLRLPIRTSEHGSCEISAVKKLLVFKGSREDIHCVASSPAGLLYSGDGACVQQWCARTGRLMQTHEAHSAAVNCLCALEGGCVSGGEDSRLVVWGEGGGRGACRCVRRLEAGVRCLALLAIPGGAALLVSGAADGEINIWNISDHSNLVLLNSLYDVMPVNSVSMSVASVAGSAGEEQQQQLQVFSGCGCSPDCCEVRCWGGEAGAAVEEQGARDFSLRILPGHRHCVLCVLSDGDSGLLTSSSADQSLRVWDDQLRLAAARDVRMSVTCMATYNGTLYTGSSDNTLIHLWKAACLTPIGAFDCHEDVVTSLCVQDGRLFSASLDLVVREHLL